jgi:short-subunit dehydrogenase
MANTTTPTQAKTQWQQQYGTWAVVTGASDGIGRETALLLAQRGQNVVLVARRRTLLEKLASEIEARYGVKALVIDADLAQTSAVDNVHTQTQNLDVGLLVAAAGFGTAGDLLDLPLERELTMLDVNCRAVFQMTQHYGQRFAQQKRGGIILFSSLVAFQGVPRSAHYAATKAYIQSLAEGIHGELGKQGVHVLASAPGPVESGFASVADMHMSQSLTPHVVAKETLAALGKSANVRPGFLSKFLIGSLNMLPRRVRVNVMGQIMKGMTAHQSNQSAKLQKKVS